MPDPRPPFPAQPESAADRIANNPALIGFIGWHNSGKTTLVNRVVALLCKRGYRVAVLKSTKERGLLPEPAQSDTAVHRGCGADPVVLLAPDQVVLRAQPGERDPFVLAERYCRQVDLVVVEGCKQAAGLAKIEVRRDATAPLLRDQVDGVIAVATDLPLTGGLVFGLDQVEAIADLIEARLLGDPPPAPATLRLLINNEQQTLDDDQRRHLQYCLQSLPGMGAITPARGPLTVRIEW